MAEDTGLPDPGEVPVWQEPLKRLTRKLTRDWKSVGWTWTTGGCFAFCEAFTATFGGEAYGLCSKDPDGDFPVEHAVVRYGDDFYDYTGRLDIGAEMAALFAKNGREIVLKAKTDEGVFWFEDDFMDDDDMERLHEAMAGCVPASGPRP